MTAALVQQLLRQKSTTPSFMTEKYKRCMRAGSRPSTAEWKEILGELIDGNKVLMVIDALDECSDETANALMSIAQDFSSIRAMITARKDFPVPRDLQQNLSKTEIVAHDEDLRSYLDWRLKNHRLMLKKEVRDSVVTTITKRCSGMQVAYSMI